MAVDSNYFENDWREAPNGEEYRKWPLPPDHPIFRSTVRMWLPNGSLPSDAASKFNTDGDRKKAEPGKGGEAPKGR